MARPCKTGVDYFPQSVEMTEEERLVMAERGLQGVAILNLLYREILKHGYYLELTEKKKVELCGILWMKKEELEGVLIWLCGIKIFDTGLLGNKILTGKGVQKIVLDIYKRTRRKQVNVKYLVKDEKEEPKKPEAKKKDPSFAEDSSEMKIAKKLYEEILEVNAKQKKPDFQKWAKEVDKMVRIDKRDPEEVLEIVDYLRNDSFWRGNILSTKKLRDHYDRLVIKKNRDGSKNFNKPSKFTNRKVVKL